MSRSATPGAQHASPILLDTHVAVWLAEGNPRLKPAKIAVIEDSFKRAELCLSPISAWEIGLLVSQKRLDLSESPLVWFNGFVHRFRIAILDLSPDIAIASSYLPGKFHGDPADRILIATAIAHSSTLLTADKQILAYGKEGFVRVVSC